MSGAVFATRLGGRLAISRAALVQLRRHEQHAPESLESGGILLVRHIPNGAADDFVVDQITEPMPADVRSRYGFQRLDQGHQKAVTEAWNWSGGTLIALGDWHTHAEPDPTPSDIDIANWKEELVGWKHEDFRLFFVIVGQRSIRVWEGHRDDMTIEQLVQIEHEQPTERAA